MRTIMNSYRQLAKFIEAMDEEGRADEVDKHFRSGVYLGIGASNLILSLVRPPFTTLSPPACLTYPVRRCPHDC